MADNTTNVFSQFDVAEDEEEKDVFAQFDVKKAEPPKSKFEQKYEKIDTAFQEKRAKAKEVITDVAGGAKGTAFGALGDAFTSVAPQFLQYKTAIEYDDRGNPIVKEGRVIPEVSIFDEPKVKEYFADPKKEKKLNNALKGYVTANGTVIYWDEEAKKEFPTARKFLTDADQLNPRTLLFAEPFKHHELDYSTIIQQYTELPEDRKGFQISRLQFSDYTQEPFTIGSMLPGTERFGGALVKDTIDYVKNTMGVTDTQTLATIAKLTESGELAGRRAISGIYTTGKFLTADAAVFIARTTQRLMNYNETRNFVPYSSDVERKIFNDRWLAGSAADLRKRLLAGGVAPMFASQEFAEKLLSFSPTIADRGFKIALDVKGFTAALGMKMTGSAIKEFEHFKNFVNARPKVFKMDADGKMVKGTYEEAIKAFKKQRYNHSQSLIGRFLDNLTTDKLVRGFEIDLAKLPPPKQRLVIDNRKALKQLTDEKEKLLNQESIRKYNKRWVDSEQPIDFDKTIVNLDRQIRQQRIITATAESTSGTPKWVRELGSQDAGFVLYGTALGQLNQNLNGDPLFGEFAGFTYAMGELLSRGTKFEKFPFLVAGSIKTTARAVENLSLKTLELYTGKGTFLDPRVATTQSKEIAELANITKTLSPQAQEYVEERVAGFRIVMDDLIKAGVSEDVLKPTLAKLSGLAAVEAFEMSVRSEMYASKTFDQDVIASLQDSTVIKKELINELKNLSAKFTENIASPEAGTMMGAFKANIKDTIESITKDIEEMDVLLKDYKNLQIQMLTEEFVSDVKGPRAAEIVKRLSELTDGQPLPLELLPEALTKDMKTNVLRAVNTEAIAQASGKYIDTVQSAIKLNKKINFNDSDDITRATTERLMEAQRELLEINGRRGFKALDTDPTLGGAKTDGTNLFNTLFDDVTSLEGKAKAFNENAMRSSDSSGLIKIFDTAANEILLNKLSVEDLADLKQAMRDDGYKEFSPSFMLHYVNETHKAKGLNILPLNLGFEEAAQIKSALTRIQNKFERLGQDGNNAAKARASAYAKYVGVSNQLFKNFKSPHGVSLQGLDVKLAEANKIYKLEYADRYFDNPLASNLVYDRKLGARDEVSDKFIAAPTTAHPEAKVFKTPSNKWFDLKKFSNNEDEAVNFNGNLRRMFGKRDKDGEYILSQDNNPDLVAHAKHITMEWIVSQLTKRNASGKLEDVAIDSPEFMLKLENIQKAYKTGDGKYLFSIDELFDKDGPLGLAQARINKKEVDAIASDTEILLQNALSKNTATKAHVERAEKINKNQATLFNANKNWNTHADVYNDLILNRTTDIGEFKSALLASNKNMKPEDVDDALRYIIAKHINEEVFQVSKDIELFPADQFGQLARQVQDVDFEKLRMLITAENRGPALKEILGDNHYNALLSISRYMELTKMRQSQIHVMGVPRSLSVESWISRIYSINRGVVSPKYVATEAALQAARKKNISTLEAIIADPDAAELFAKIILDKKPLDEKLGKRLLGAIAFHFSYSASRVGWRDYIIEGGDAQLQKTGYWASKAAGAVIPDAIQPDALIPSNEVEQQMQSLRFVKNKRAKKLWGAGTIFKNYAEWKAAQPELRTSMYMNQ